jgi:pyruvate dehydrogenase E1 component beta subunit
MPYSAADAKGLLKTAIRDPEPGDLPRKRDPLWPLLRGAEGGRPDDPLRQGRIWREGTDVTIVSFGIGMTYALEAAEKLAKDGIEAEVIDLRTLRPLDYDTVIASVMKTNRCVTVVRKASPSARSAITSRPTS